MWFPIYVHKCTDKTAMNVLVSPWEPSGAPLGTGGGRLIQNPPNLWRDHGTRLARRPAS